MHREINNDIGPSNKIVRHQLSQLESLLLALRRTDASRLSVVGTLALILCALVLWSASLSSINPRNMSDLGLVSVLPVSFYAAVGLLSISFCLALRDQRTPTLILLAHIVALIVIIHGTLPLVYAEPRYSWTYKHIGVTDYIQQTGGVDPSIDAYHNFPAFFALAAFFNEVAGFTSALSYANWAQLFFNLLYLGALLLIFKSCTSDRRLIWLAVWFFFLTSWVGQDYFAPQAFGYFFYLVIIGISLTWFQQRKQPSEDALRRWLVFAPLVRFFRKLFSLAEQNDAPELTSHALQRVGVMAIIILSFGVIVSSHELTPPMTIASIVALLIFQRHTVRSLPILMGVLFVAWLIFMATAFLRDNESLLSSFGLLSSNLTQNIRGLSQTSPDHAWVALITRGLSVALWGLALLGGVRRWREGRLDLSLVLVSLAPIPMIALQSYGGEMVYRIFLFSLPGMAFLAAAVFRPAPLANISWKMTITALLASSVLFAGFLFAYYGMERMNYMSQAEVEAVQYLYHTAPRGSLLLSVTWNLPIKLQGNYNQYAHIPLFKQYASGNFGIQEAVFEMTRPQYPAAYLIFSRGQKNHDEILDVLPSGTYDRLTQAVAQSNEFKLVFENNDVQIYMLADEKVGGIK